MEYIEPNSERYLSLEDLPNEVWKDIKDYKGLYQISDYGRVKSLERYVKTGIKHSTLRRIKPKICRVEFKRGSSPYCRIQLRKDKKYTHHSVHCLVAEAFLDKHDFKYCEGETLTSLADLEINHKDENIKNNMLSNLEWCTHLYNMRYGTRLERAVKNANETKKRKKEEYLYGMVL